MNARVLEGDFDPAFLALPDEILITVMRGHQNILPSRSAAGKSPAFSCGHQSSERSQGIGAPGMNGLAGATGRRSILLGVGSEMSARRLSPKA
jgi:hypothetical protein